MPTIYLDLKDLVKKIYIYIYVLKASRFEPLAECPFKEKKTTKKYIYI